MKIRNKILVYFSSTVIVLSAVSLTVVFLLFAAHREEEFQQQQYAKIKYTVGLIEEFKEISAELSSLLDAQDIHDFYDEKLLVFDGNKSLIFSSIDSLDISRSNAILSSLSVSNRWIETKEDGYDLIGVYVEHNKKGYYGISKAYDALGHSKKDFLRNVLILMFFAIALVVVLLSFYLSNIIAKPISYLSEKLQGYDLSKEQNPPLKLNTSTYELQYLTDRFNALLRRTNESFLFQKHTIQHISHELKTPISVLVSQLEKIQQATNIEQVMEGLKLQTQKAKSLGDIINVLLQISKIESGQEPHKEIVRVDEVVFDSIDQIKNTYPDFQFEVNYHPDEFDENGLNVLVNRRLVMQAFLNLLMNCVDFADDSKAKIMINCEANRPIIMISNTGETLTDDEERYLFSHFFRGKNASQKAGFGLGLVLARRIFSLHGAVIRYRSENESTNIFEIHFRL